MRRIRIFHAGDLSSGLTVMLNANASHHMLQVLRKKAGEQFWIFNGHGGEFEATLTSANKKIACVSVGAFHVRQTESALLIHLGQAISRGERMDYSIQKSVELGVHEITPLLTEFCQVQLSDNRIEKRVAHWQAIATSAAEQSGRCYVPTINPPLSFSAWIQKNHSTKLICCPRVKKNPHDRLSVTSVDPISLTIGSEGGFSDTEVRAAQDQQFTPLSLGPRILRTETAAVVAITLLQMRWGDLCEISH